MLEHGRAAQILPVENPDQFSLDKIMNAIVKAFDSVNCPADLGTISKILSHLDIHDDITVENIQNQVEEALMSEGFYHVAKSLLLTVY